RGIGHRGRPVQRKEHSPGRVGDQQRFGHHGRSLGGMGLVPDPDHPGAGRDRQQRQQRDRRDDSKAWTRSTRFAWHHSPAARSYAPALSYTSALQTKVPPLHFRRSPRRSSTAVMAAGGWMYARNGTRRRRRRKLTAITNRWV